MKKDSKEAELEALFHLLQLLVAARAPLTIPQLTLWGGGLNDDATKKQLSLLGSLTSIRSEKVWTSMCKEGDCSPLVETN